MACLLGIAPPEQHENLKRAGRHWLVEGESDPMRLNTFLNFGGNCEQAFRFY